MSQLGLRLATQYLRDADAQELLHLTEALMPALVAALSPQERIQFLKVVIQDHLGTLLQGINPGERAVLLAELMPSLSAAFDMNATGLSACWRASAAE